jgi:kinesin family member 14
MLATISPSNVHIEETLSTLRYAKQTRTIVNVAKINEDATARLIIGFYAEMLMLMSC